MSSEPPEGTGDQPLSPPHEQMRLALALDCARMGTWDWDLKLHTVSWDRQMHLLFGIEPGSFGGNQEDFLALVHPADRGRVAAEMARALQHCAEIDGEFRAVWPSDRSTHVIRIRAKV